MVFNLGFALVITLLVITFFCVICKGGSDAQNGGGPDVQKGCPDVQKGCPDVQKGCPGVQKGCPDVAVASGGGEWPGSGQRDGAWVREPDEHSLWPLNPPGFLGQIFA